MEWVELDHGDVTEYGSHGIYMREAARLKNVDELAVHVASIAPGGSLGRHPTRLWQLFAVTAGSGWVTASDGVPQPIRAGQAVLWHPGEEHESGSHEGMSVVITQSSVRLPGGTGVQSSQ